MMIATVAVRYVEDYQMICLAGSLTVRVTRLAHEVQLDAAPLGKAPYLHMPGLLVTDVDSTATQVERIGEIAKLTGTGEMAVEVTERAMRGEPDFTASLCSRAVTSKGVDTNTLQQVRENLPLTPGLTQLVLRLETPGWEMAIAPGGFTFSVEYLRDKLYLIAMVVNELEIVDGKFTGNVIGDVVDVQYRAKTLTYLAQEHEIPLTQIVTIDDGANDLPMIKAARLGVAYRAKPKVNEKAEVTTHHADLMGVFCILSGSSNQR